MHSRAKGNARSHKPLNPTKPSWVHHSTKELEMLVAKLAKDGKSASDIGVILRDSYGVPSVKVIAGKRIQQLLAEKKLLPELPEDMMSLIRRAAQQRKHLQTNKQDMDAKRGLLLTESKIKRLAKYYKATGKVAESWKYDPSSMRVYT